jgi:hypothetical protein
MILVDPILTNNFSISTMMVMMRWHELLRHNQQSTDSDLHNRGTIIY